MIGDHYWSTGIIVKYGGRAEYQDEWAASLTFHDDGFAQKGTTEGTLTTRYFEPLAQAIDTIKADAEKLGIVFRPTVTRAPHIFAYEDGLSDDWPMPDGWRKLLHEQAERIGWDCIYIREKETQKA
jgi:hypothetical protein